MKKSNYLTTAAATLVALVAVAGVGLAIHAQEDDSATTFERPFMHNWQNLSNEEKIALEADREARRADAEARHDEMEAAIAQGYDAFVAAADEDCPMLDQVTEENFPTFQEAHNLMNQAHEKFESIGIERGFGMGKMMGGRGGHMGKFGGRGMQGGYADSLTQ